MTSNTTASVARRRISSRLLMGAAAAGAGVVLLSVSAFSGTYAHWADTEQLDLGTITSGSLQLEVNDSSSITLDSSRFARMLPGDRVVTPVELTTSGTVASTVSVTATSTGFGSHVVRVTPAACSGTALTGAPVGASPVGLGTWAAEDVRTVCIEVSLPQTAPATAQGNTTAIDLTFLAAQAVD